MPTPPTPAKTRQVNIRLTPEQDLLLRQYCTRTGISTQAALIKALQGLIDGF